VLFSSKPFGHTSRRRFAFFSGGPRGQWERTVAVYVAGRVGLFSARPSRAERRRHAQRRPKKLTHLTGCRQDGWGQSGNLRLKCKKGHGATLLISGTDAGSACGLGRGWGHGPIWFFLPFRDWRAAN